MEGLPDGAGKQFRLTFDRNKMPGGKVSVSRVDGNHRLHYSEGDDRRDPLLEHIPFQLHVGLSRDQERQLFVDINANQKGLNTSHLAIMQSKLTPEQLEIRDHLDRWIAKRLTDDPGSPWHGIVHLGGSKKGSRAQGLPRAVNFASLQTGVGRTISKSQYLHDLTDPQAQYAIIRNYWQAAKTVFAQEWGAPKAYLLLKNIGVLSLSILGGTIIDRCLARGQYEVADLARYLEQTRLKFDWSSDNSGDRGVAGMTGNMAALIIAGEMAAELSDDAGASLMKGLQAKLLGETARDRRSISRRGPLIGPCSVAGALLLGYEGADATAAGAYRTDDQPGAGEPRAGERGAGRGEERGDAEPARRLAEPRLKPLQEHRLSLR